MSDARRVKGVRVLENALRRLISLKPVEYRANAEAKNFESGFIAQDLFKVFPELVVKPNPKDNGTDPLPPGESPIPRGWFVGNLDGIIPWIVGAVIDLTKVLDEVDQTVRRRTRMVDRRLDELESRVSALENPSSNP
jgi:hypothetical protein